MHRIKWLLVEWENRSSFFPQYGLVSVKSLVNRKMELHTGKLVLVTDPTGPPKRAKIVMVSDDRRFLERQLVTMEEHSQQVEAAAEACRAAVENRSLQSPIVKPSQRSSLPVQTNNAKARYSRSSSWSDDNSDNETLNNYSRSHHHHDQRLPLSKSKVNYTNQNHDVYKHKSKYNHRFNVYPSVASTPRPELKRDERPVTFYDQGTQTGMRFHSRAEDIVPKLEEKITLLESVIDEMADKISILEGTIDSWMVRDFDDNSRAPEYMIEFSVNSNKQASVSNVVEEDIDRHDNTNIEIPIVNQDETQNTLYNLDEMVPIGSGKAMVSRHILQQIDWNSYTMATRKLLMSLFPRRTLATHSLTGKCSPAFSNKPAKLCLDPAIVNDIVTTVTQKCNVKESLVRSAITTKCADENKMFRIRQGKRDSKRASGGGVNNQENLPPSGKVEPI